MPRHVIKFNNVTISFTLTLLPNWSQLSKLIIVAITMTVTSN